MVDTLEGFEHNDWSHLLHSDHPGIRNLAVTMSGPIMRDLESRLTNEAPVSGHVGAGEPGEQVGAVMLLLSRLTSPLMTPVLTLISTDTGQLRPPIHFIITLLTIV